MCFFVVLQTRDVCFYLKLVYLLNKRLKNIGIENIHLKLEHSLNYSTVTELGGGGAVEYADAFFCFTITFRTPLLQLPLYSQYQFFLYENISKLRHKGLSFNKIAEWLNKKGYLSSRVTQ